MLLPMRSSCWRAERAASSSPRDRQIRSSTAYPESKYVSDAIEYGLFAQRDGLFCQRACCIQLVPLAQDLCLQESRPAYLRQHKSSWLCSQLNCLLGQLLCLMQLPCSYHIHDSCAHDTDSESWSVLLPGQESLLGAHSR